MDGHCKNGLAIFFSYSDAIDVTENDEFPTDFVFFYKSITDNRTDPLTEMR